MAHNLDEHDFHNFCGYDHNDDVHDSAGFVEHDDHHNPGGHINLDDDDLDHLDNIIDAYLNRDNDADARTLDYVRAINDATNRILRYDTDINRLAAALNNVDNYSDTDFDPIGALVDAARTITTRHTVGRRQQATTPVPVRIRA